MAKMNRKQLRKIILREIKKMEEDALYTQHKTGHDFRSSKHTSCSECGAKMYEGDEGVCEQCGSMNEKHHHDHDEHVHVFENGACSECGIMEEDAALNEGSCGGCGSRGGCSSMTEDTDFQDLLDLIISQEEDENAKIGNHKIYKGSYMARSHLYKVAKYAEKLYNMIPEGHNLADWMRSKIAQIADDVGEVYHAIDHVIFDGDV